VGGEGRGGKSPIYLTNSIACFEGNNKKLVLYFLIK
jgi:hypothetical protein